MTIDFANPDGAALVRRLAAEADVVVENFKTGGLAKYGLDYESLKAVNARLVYCSVTGFGQTGPYAHRAGYDFLIQGMGAHEHHRTSGRGRRRRTHEGWRRGVRPVHRHVCGGRHPRGAGASRPDGEGQHIDCALFDSQVAMLANQSANWLAGGMVPGRLGNNHPNVVPYRVYPTADGHVIVACGNDNQFQRLCAGPGPP